MKVPKLYQSTLFKKYFLSYLGLFIFAFFLFSSYVYVTTIKEISKEVEETNLGHLQQIEVVIGEQFRNIKTLADRMGIDRELVPYKVRDNLYTNQTASQLKLYKESHSWIDELYVYFEGANVHSSEGTLSINTLSSLSPYFEEKRSDNNTFDFTAITEHVSSISYYPRSDQEAPNRLLYSVPLRSGALNPHGIVFFVIDSSEIIKLLNTIPNASSLILSENNTPIVYSENIAVDNVNKWVTQLSNMQDNHFSIDNNEFISSSSKNNRFNWTFTSIVDSNDYYRNIQAAYKSLSIFVFFSIIGGATLSLILTLYHYRPIKKLLENVTSQNLFENDERIQSIDNIDRVNDVVSEVISENKVLQKELFNYKPLVRNQIFIELLEGKLNADQSLKLFNRNELVSGSDKYFVTAIDVKDNYLKAINSNSIDNISKKYMDYEIDGLVVNSLYLDFLQQLIFIIGTSDEIINDSNQITMLLRKLQKEVQSNYGNELTMGVGTPYSSLAKVKQSYIEATSALTKAYSRVDKDLVLFREIENKKYNSFSTVYKKQLLLLDQSLKQGEKEVAKDTLQSLRNYLNDENISRPVKDFISFEIVQSILNISEDYGVKSIFTEIEKILSERSLNNKVNYLEYYVDEICDVLNSKKKEDKNSFALKMLKYIEKNYLANDMSLELIADEFNFSVSYTSRLIKEHKGVSFTKLIQDMRMEEFKRRLVHTDIPIKHLVSEIGYVDVSNFTRKFKSLTGLTPTGYRKKHLQQN